MPEIINLQRAARPEFTPKQVNFMQELIGMGVTRLAIAAIVLETDAAALNPSQVTSVNRQIQRCYKALGYNITDSRNVRSPFMQEAVQRAARQLRVRVRIA